LFIPIFDGGKPTCPGAVEICNSTEVSWKCVFSFDEDAIALMDHLGVRKASWEESRLVYPLTLRLAASILRRPLG
jgi:hypothetical protein